MEGPHRWGGSVLWGLNFGFWLKLAMPIFTVA